MNKQIKITLLCLILNIISAGSQNIPTISHDIKPVSPTASQISRYDELPVSEYTGVPNISIPFYKIEVDEVKLPIDLTYHAGGIKVNQDASWVGLGWNLSLGSLIQIINDEDDLISGARNRRCLPDYMLSAGITAG